MSTLIITIVGSQALFSFIQFLITRNDSRRTTVELAILAILRDRLLHLCNKYLEAGCIDIYEQESFCRLYEAYSNLGGNSFIEDLHGKVINLPIK